MESGDSDEPTQAQVLEEAQVPESGFSATFPKLAPSLNGRRQSSQEISRDGGILGKKKSKGLRVFCNRDGGILGEKKS